MQVKKPGGLERFIFIKRHSGSIHTVSSYGPWLI